LCLTTNSHTITFADPNFKSALLSATTENYIATRFDSNYGCYRSIKVDYNDDGEIQLDEALSIDGLNLSSIKNISALSEIYLFSNLEGLDCSNNLLKTLIFSGTITTARMRLNCSNNQLSQLNIASLTNLFELSCQNNQLKTLDILGFRKLREINCSHNQLTTLIVNAQVEYCQVYLDWSNNLLSSLYMYGNDVNSLKCNNNLLTSKICTAILVMWIVVITYYLLLIYPV
jgi:hypothetical protein